MMGMSRAMYETKKYDAARDMGSDCINVSRWILGVHKYVALSHKALGGIDEAKKKMSGQFCMKRIGTRTIYNKTKSCHRC